MENISATNQKRQKPKKKSTILFGLATTVLIILVFSFVAWLAEAFPFVKGSKDWLDILSAIGQAAGVVVLIGLVYEMYHQESESQRKHIPDIEISIKVVNENVVPEGAKGCLVEKNQPPKNLHPNDQYQEVWDLLNLDQTTHFLRVDVSNRQWEREGLAQQFQMNIEFTYSEGEDPTKDHSAKNFWCPQEIIDIQPGNRPVTFYVRCGKPWNPRLTHISGQIKDYRCTNLRGDSFTGTHLGFKPRIIPRQPFRERHEIAE